MSWQLDIYHFILIGLAFAAGALASWVVVRYRLRGTAPVARAAAVESMSDAVIAIDVQNQIVDANPAAVRLFGREKKAILGRPLSEILPQYAELFEQYREFLQAHDELHLELGDRERWYDMQLSALYDRQERLRGRLLVLRDISERKELEAVLEMQIRRVNQLLDVARATTEHPTLEATLQSTLDIAASLTQADTGSILLLDDQQRVTRSILTRGDAPPLERVSVLGQVLDDGLAGWVLRERQTALVEDTANDPRWVTLPDQPYEARSALGVPICHGDRTLGVLVLLHAEPRHFDPDQVYTLGAAATQMALAIRNTQFYENQRRLAHQQTTLYNALRALQRPMMLREVVPETVRVIAELTEWPLVALVAVDPSGEARVEASGGAMASEVSLHAWLVNEVLSEGLRVGEEIYIPDACGGGGGSPEEPTCSLLLVPLKREDDVRRALFIAVDTPMAFDQDARLLARSLGDAVALVLRNAQLYETVAIERGRLAALVESTREGIILIGVEENILVINQRALDDAGLDGAPEEWVYRPIQAFLGAVREHAPAFASAGLEEVERIARGDASVGEGEHQVDGRVLQWFNLPVREGERAVGRLFILHDVTEERVVARMREDLTHTMVHDLRNPLTGIHGALLMIEKPLQEALPPEMLNMLGIAQRGTERMLGLVNAILDISRLESGRMPLSPTMFPVEDLIAETLELARPLSVREGIELVNGAQGHLPPAWADREMIGRVLQNLVDNALKFTPQGGTVRVEVRVPRDQPKLHVVVSDTGPGIPPEIKGQLFQKFVTGQQEGHGSGLGLAFCRMVLEAHGERVWVESDHGRGTTFVFTLPQAADIVG